MARFFPTTGGGMLGERFRVSSRWPAWHLIAWLLIAFYPGVKAHGLGSTPIVYYDSGGMPRCLQNPNHPSESYYLYWQDYRQYDRTIFVAPVLDVPDGYQFGCAQWAGYARQLQSLDGSSYLTPMPPDAKSIGSLQLSAPLRKALSQVRTGARVFREEETADEFLKHHPIDTYTRETNWRLTDDYGPAFSGAVFRLIRLRRPANQKAHSAILQYMQGHRAGPAPLAQRLAKSRMLVARGYLEDPSKSKVRRFIERIKKIGIQVELLEMDSTGAVESNRRQIAKTLTQYLDRGEHLILAGASKGFPELLGALVDVSSQTHKGTVDAVMSLSGNLGGSFLVDWADMPVLRSLVFMLISSAAKAMGTPIEDVAPGFLSQGTSAVHSYMDKIKSRLPKSPVYIEFSGILSETPYAKDSFIADMQESLLNTAMFPRHAANDGFVEYPGTEIDPSWVPNLYQLTFEASHSLVDGHFDRYDMADDTQYDSLLRAMLHFVADQVETLKKSR